MIGRFTFSSFSGQNPPSSNERPPARQFFPPSLLVSLSANVGIPSEREENEGEKNVPRRTLFDVVAVVAVAVVGAVFLVLQREGGAAHLGGRHHDDRDLCP